MDDSSGAESIDRACARLINLFGWCVDHQEYDQVLDLFTEDAIIERSEQHFSGRAAIRSMLNARPSMIKTLHIFSNIIITPQANNVAEGRCYFILFASASARNLENPPIESGTSRMAGAIKDVFSNDGSGWKIRNRSILPHLDLSAAVHHHNPGTQ